MPAATDEQFEQSLNEDLGWRRIELSALRQSLHSASRTNPDSPSTRALSRAMVAMCYAHWEGFSKNALASYGKLVVRRKPSISMANEGLVVQHMRRLLKRMESGDQSARISLSRIARGEPGQRLDVDKAIFSDTKGNLRYATLQELFHLGCLPIDQFELKANLIDKHLCDQRNAIAHGRETSVSADDAIQLCAKAIELIEEMRSILIGHVRTKGYLIPEEDRRPAVEAVTAT